MIRFQPLPSPATDAEVQEAESIRYGPTAFMILPLSSGRVAVLGHMRDLHAIVDTLDEAVEASKSIPFLVWRRAVAEKETKRPLVDIGTLDL